jgi:hypothetical protein
MQENNFRQVEIERYHYVLLARWNSTIMQEWLSFSKTLKVSGMQRVSKKLSDLYSIKNGMSILFLIILNILARKIGIENIGAQRKPSTKWNRYFSSQIGDGITDG